MNILIDGQTLHTPEINRGIGTYFIEMIEAMLRNDFVNRFYITIDAPARLKVFSNFAQNKLICITDKPFNPSYFLNDNSKNSSHLYSRLVEETCKQFSIDVYWNPNPQMTNTLLPNKITGVHCLATIFDLIPLKMKKHYYSCWPDLVQKEYLIKINKLRDYDLLFPISQSTKNDLKNLTQIPEEKMKVTFCGINSKFKPFPFPTIKQKSPYILYLGGFDPRKNMYKAIDAFALFLRKYNTAKIHYKLYLVCEFDDNSHHKLTQYIAKTGVINHVVITGFLDEPKLLKIYQKASCFFFPSTYEGFGLPILEALSSGLPIACADNSSLPEVAGNFAHYFESENIKQMAISIRYALDRGMDFKLRQMRHKYASEYSWEKAANILLKELISLNKQNENTIKRKIAWVSPLPPMRSGISIYSKQLLFVMENLAEIDVFFNGLPYETNLVEHFNIFPLNELKEKFHNYDEVIYHLGNNSEFHTEIYKMAWKMPSTIVIHDWNIHPFMQHSFLNSKNNSYYEDAINYYGDSALKQKEQTKINGYPELWEFPMIDAIAEKSKRIIVHHQWVKDQLHDKLNVDVIPLFSFIENEPSQGDINEFRSKFSLSKKDYLIASFGDVNYNKLPDIQIQAVKELINLGYPVKLIFIGKVQEDTFPLFERLKNTIYEDKIFATGFLLNKEFISGLYACDLVINLRNPSMGEASLTLAEALYAKIPTIIGDSNQYKEFPDEIVAGRIQYNGNEAEQLLTLIQTNLENSNLKPPLQKNMEAYVNSILNIQNVAQMYLKK